MKDMKLIRFLKTLEILKILLVPYILFVNLSCSSKRSDIVSMEIKPTNPIVINADFTAVDALGNKITYTAPWFHFYIELTNGSAEDTVTIVTLTGKITSTTSASGGSSFESKEFSFDTTGALGQAYLVELKPLESKKLDIPFYVYGLPKGDEKTFRYTGFFKTVGWIGTHNDATKSLITYPVYFSTE